MCHHPQLHDQSRVLAAQHSHLFGVVAMEALVPDNVYCDFSAGLLRVFGVGQFFGCLGALALAHQMAMGPPSHWDNQSHLYTLPNAAGRRRHHS